MTTITSTVTSTEFTPSNELERLLIAAATDPTQRPRFYRELLDSELHILVFYDEIGVRIQPVKRDGVEIIPLFSSSARLEEFVSAAKIEEYKQDHGSGRELLTILETAHVILNPVSIHQKELKPRETKAILNGALLRQLKVIPLDAAEMEIYTLPDPYPHELVNDLKASFAFSKMVKRAYLAEVKQKDRLLPQLVIGLEADEGYVAAEPAEIARESLGDDEFICFIKLGTDSVSEFMLDELKPFYVRAEEESEFDEESDSQ